MFCMCSVCGGVGVSLCDTCLQVDATICPLPHVVRCAAPNRCLVPMGSVCQH